MTINSKDFLEYILKNGTNFITGVPDSLLKNFLSCLNSLPDNCQHIIAANEGNAIALGVGHYLATQKLPLVYLQNSGLGNIINPILSLTHKNVYSIPMLLMIGWRGEPGTKDEPQHTTQGAITTSLLDLVEIPYFIIDEHSSYRDLLSEAFDLARNIQAPVALLVRKNSFSKPKASLEEASLNLLSREDALKYICNTVSSDSVVISSTGMISREYYEHKINADNTLNTTFLTVGSMGHASSIASGFAVSSPNTKVVLLDGDGALLMHMGSLPVNSSLKLNNMSHILLNNQCHDSVGGQPTCADNVDFPSLALACGYKNVFQLRDETELNKIDHILNLEGSFIEILVRPGHRNNLLRPTTTPLDNKKEFLSAFLRGIDDNT